MELGIASLKLSRSTTILFTLIVLGIAQNGVALIYCGFLEDYLPFLFMPRSIVWHALPFLLPLILMVVYKSLSQEYGILLYCTVSLMILTAMYIYLDHLILDVDLESFFFLAVWINQWAIAAGGIVASVVLRCAQAPVRLPQHPRASESQS